MEEKFDKFAVKLAQKYKYQEVPWAVLTQVVLCIYLVLTSLSMLLRPDFLSVTACALGIYATECPQNVKRSMFRLLVLLVAITFIYDIVFLLFIHDSEQEDNSAGGMQTNLRRFAYFFTWISFFFRPVVILVLWKVSLDFRKIMRNKIGGGRNATGAGN
jgi:hypothetical protein